MYFRMNLRFSSEFKFFCQFDVSSCMIVAPILLFLLGLGFYVCVFRRFLSRFFKEVNQWISKSFMLLTSKYVFLLEC